jgi:hypothetical protein
MLRWLQAERTRAHLIKVVQLESRSSIITNQSLAKIAKRPAGTHRVHILHILQAACYILIQGLKRGIMEKSSSPTER